MEKIYVTGKSGPLQGTVKVSGAKNAALPILAAALLCKGTTIIDEVPQLEDVNVMRGVLESLGAKVKVEGDTYIIDSSNLTSSTAPYELVRKMRASFLVMGPLLARLKEANISMPGGCAIGTRPIDLHLKGFQALGAKIQTDHGCIEGRVDNLVGNRVYLDFPSVGATENIMMLATMAEGQTIIENAAAEPEIVDLANYLNSMGAKIRGAGTNVIKITGVKELTSNRYTVIPDRIEAGTYMVAAVITGGDVLITNCIYDHLKPVIAKLQECGAKVFEDENTIRVIGNNRPIGVDVKTLPYPGFPTDMQPQMTALLAVAEGTSVVTETVFENRFMHVDELKRMNAKIKIRERSAVITGVESLKAAPVYATDLRAGAALILAGLVAEGVTEIGNIHHIDRGYVDIVNKFKGLGAKIERK
ncbi:UDP-N-acetylglucosamine 1-carboxyvinyltransferase [Anaerobranca californiensis DSM 14826]|uniref:UDP-N-acetylglucosamine 1-carboxyvinyltransferase n=1 Tax=Anaerobranca californiensis DSM 14826 TaxID=1120989 RepID=A0A1M6MBN7_9FIRM|nr:UDP-N-acetylglucosamine 1-carboxyvinyltransferase [Anaerobranca californiensis]SHJ80825.1 UDP-N-acetylglucosamine 1-carboxyvinyltransferase [Anaerobranca californiensis DSM 14826]